MGNFRKFNPNPHRSRAGDCVIRAIAKAFGKDWGWVYVRLCLQGLLLGDWGNGNAVWGAFLKKHGFRRHIIPETLPESYSIADFAKDHPEGTFILATGSHVVCLQNGFYFDSWDSGDEIPVYFWQKQEG